MIKKLKYQMNKISLVKIIYEEKAILLRYLIKIS